MHKRSPFILLILIILFSLSCGKEGLGGKATISGRVIHHAQNIPNAIVYIKYGATELPGTSPSVYDDQVQAGTDATFIFEDLKPGNYYLFSVGYDADIFDSVFGGIGVELTRGEDLETFVPVTE